MNGYVRQKQNLEAQGWRAYQKKAGRSVYFCKDGISGIVVIVDAYSGEAVINVGAPPDFAAKHSPQLI